MALSCTTLHTWVRFTINGTHHFCLHVNFSTFTAAAAAAAAAAAVAGCYRMLLLAAAAVAAVAGCYKMLLLIAAVAAAGTCQCCCLPDVHL